jgi:hypothetical protein
MTGIVFLVEVNTAMTQAEKNVLNVIVAELEKVTKAVIDLQEKTNTHTMVQLQRNYDKLRSQLDALPSK